MVSLREKDGLFLQLEILLVTCSLRVEAVAVSPLMDEGEQGMVAGPEAEEHCLAHVPVG